MLTLAELPEYSLSSHCLKRDNRVPKLVQALHEKETKFLLDILLLFCEMRFH